MNIYDLPYSNQVVEAAIGNASREATTELNGLMSSEDKAKLNSITPNKFKGAFDSEASLNSIPASEGDVALLLSKGTIQKYAITKTGTSVIYYDLSMPQTGKVLINTRMKLSSLEDWTEGAYSQQWWGLRNGKWSIGGELIADAPTPKLDEWYDIEFRQNDLLRELHVDGVLVATRTAAKTSITDNIGLFGVGTFESAKLDGFTATKESYIVHINDIAVFDLEISEDGILSNKINGDILNTEGIELATESVEVESNIANVKTFDGTSWISANSFPVEVQSALNPITKWMENYINDESPVLKAFLYQNGVGMPTTVNAYLWHDTSLNFYTSESSSSEKKYMFTWDNVRPPSHYSMTMLNKTDVLCVFRTEIYTSGANDDIRENPFIYAYENGTYTKKIIDFGSGIKPSAWVLSAGFCPLLDGSGFLMCEYGRPSIEAVRCWKVVGDPSNASNWAIVKEDVLSGDLYTGFKHYHGVQIDPYTGIYWLTSGDDDVGSHVWYSKDGGQIWTDVLPPSERYNRMLNMIYTKDHIYWATDSGYRDTHSLFRATKTVDGVYTMDTIEILYDFPFLGGGSPGVATYGTVYLPLLNYLVFLERADGQSIYEIPIYAWNLDNSTMETVTTMTSDENNAGFRVECANLYPTDNKVQVGFGYELFGVSDNRNKLKVAGNTDYKVRNLELEFYRVDNKLNISIRTIK